MQQKIKNIVEAKYTVFFKGNLADADNVFF